MVDATLTTRARRVLLMAQEEARALNHNYVGTEHLLLGLLAVEGGAAARALQSLGVDLDAVRDQVEQIIGRGRVTPSGPMAFTPRTKTVLTLSQEEALRLGHDQVGTEHLLLALVGEGRGVAPQILAAMGWDAGRVRRQVEALLQTDPPTGSARPPAPGSGRPGGAG